MGYLDNSSITVDAVLTKKGREILKNGGNLNITSFTLSDTGVDYTLWNPDHPSGSAYYGEAIENLPMLEASVHAEYNLRNRLISLNQNAVAVPALVLDNLDTSGGTEKTFNHGDEATGDIGIKLVGYTTSQNHGFYAVIQDTSIVTANLPSQPGGSLSGTSRMFLSEQDIPYAVEYKLKGAVQDGLYTATLPLAPLQQSVSGKQTNVYIVDIETGAYNSFVVTNNITETITATLSTVRSS
jgi:hypothetical protein